MKSCRVLEVPGPRAQGPGRSAQGLGARFTAQGKITETCVKVTVARRREEFFDTTTCGCFIKIIFLCSLEYFEIVYLLACIEEPAGPCIPMVKASVA